MRRRARWTARAAALLTAASLASAALSGCGASPAPLGPAGIDELTIPTPSPDPADFTGDAQNAWFPLTPGTRWTYRQYTPTAVRTVIAQVLTRQREIAGISTTGVRWQVRSHRRWRTLMVRWYAVDTAGDVWWFGQRVAPHTPPLDRLAPRSWLAGRRGAQAGLILSAAPRQGDGYYNARRRGVVERRSTVESLRATVATPTRTYRHAVATLDLSSLAPLHVVQTYYERGLGMVAQEDTEATSTSLALERVRPGSG